MGVESWLSGWEGPGGVPVLLECCSMWMPAVGSGVSSKFWENPTAKARVRCSPSPRSSADRLRELLLWSTWKRQPYRIKITGKKETMPSGSSGESWRPGWHYLRQAVYSSFPTHSWDVSNHNCEWHPAGPFWDQVPLYKCSILGLEAAELLLTSIET